LLFLFFSFLFFSTIIMHMLWVFFLFHYFFFYLYLIVFCLSSTMYFLMQLVCVCFILKSCGWMDAVDLNWTEWNLVNENNLYEKKKKEKVEQHP
jgi:hypothetical protein